VALFLLQKLYRIEPREIFRKENLLLAVRAVGRSVPKSSGELRVQIPVRVTNTKKTDALHLSFLCCTSFPNRAPRFCKRKNRLAVRQRKQAIPQSDSELRVQIPVRVTNKKSVTRSVALFLLQKLYRLSLRDPNPSPFVLF
jgi:hypothetical protein